MISRVKTVLDSNVQFLTKKTIPKHTKKLENITHSKEYVNQQKWPKKDLIADLLDKDFKITVLSMLKELKDKLKKVKKMIYEQNKNISEEIEKPIKKPKKEILEL